MADREKLLLWCRKYCNNPNIEDTEDFALVLDRLLELFDQVGVVSEKLSDMSQTFGNETAITVKNMLSPYKRLKSL